MNPDSHVIFVAILTALTSSGVMSLIIYLLQRRDMKKDREEIARSAQSRMILGLGHDKIIYLTDKYVRRGAISLKEKRNLDFLCNPYFEMGGNGDCRIGYDACLKLQVVSDEVAEEMDLSIKRKEYAYENE